MSSRSYPVNMSLRSYPSRQPMAQRQRFSTMNSVRRWVQGVNPWPRRPISLPPRAASVRMPAKPKKQEDLFSDLLNVVRRGSCDPVLLGFGVLILAFLYSHNFDISSGPVKEWSETLSNETKSGRFVKASVPKVIGLAVYLPTLVSSPEKSRGPLVFLSIAVLLFMPVCSIYQYSAQSALLYFFFKSRVPSTRMFVVFAALASLLTGLLFPTITILTEKPVVVSG